MSTARKIGIHQFIPTVAIQKKEPSDNTRKRYQTISGVSLSDIDLDSSTTSSAKENHKENNRVCHKQLLIQSEIS